LNKARALKILNPVLAFLFIVQIASGLFGIAYQGHRALGLLLVAVIGTHLFLNWGWVRANLFKR
jgi:hypothetical protein